MLPGSWGEGWVPCLTLEPATEVELEVELAEVVSDGGRWRWWTARMTCRGCVGRAMDTDMRRALNGAGSVRGHGEGRQRSGARRAGRGSRDGRPRPLVVLARAVHADSLSEGRPLRPPTFRPQALQISALRRVDARVWPPP